MYNCSKTAKRLKDLRTAKKLSHEKLAASLNEKYGINISSASLKNYEIFDVNHTKHGKVKGMNIEYLFHLSDFFNVSADYLLGLSDVPTNDKDLQSVCDYTGLPVEAIEIISGITKDSPDIASSFFSCPGLILLVGAGVVESCVMKKRERGLHEASG